MLLLNIKEVNSYQLRQFMYHGREQCEVFEAVSRIYSLCFGAMYLMPKFRRNILSASSVLKMRTACFSETMAITYETTWRQIRKNTSSINYVGCYS
jgi:hypothetical protein